MRITSGVESHEKVGGILKGPLGHIVNDDPDNIFNMIFKVPPRKPDARMFFMGGAGLITALRGVLFIWGRPLQASVFQVTPEWFILFWGLAWIFTGLAAMIVAATGHWKRELDYSAAFLLMALWLVWGVLYIVSGFIAVFNNLPNADADFYQALSSVVTGLVLAAGIVTSIRKTQAMTTLELALDTIHQLRKENNELRESFKSPNPE